MHREMLSIQGKGYSKINSENPFHESPPPKAFYHPTKEKSLSTQEKQLALSPKRGDKPQQDGEGGGGEAGLERKFLSGSHAIKPLSAVTSHLPKNPDSDNFDESWPDSERPSSPSLTADDQWTLPYPNIRKHVQPTFTSRHLAPSRPSAQTGSDRFSMMSGAALHGAEDYGGGIPRSERETFAWEEGRKEKEKSGEREEVVGERGGSVLQRYIERFRHGTPTSREERLRRERGERENNKDDFWWLDPASSSNGGLPTPNSTSTPKEHLQGRSLGLTAAAAQGRGTLTVENVRQQDALDLATAELQEKAERILHSAGSATSSGPLVSTEGLGSTGSDVTGSSFSEAAVHPSFLPRETGVSLYPGVRGQGRKGEGSLAGPREDILYKWRLQRKLESARQRPYVSSGETADRPPPKTAAEKDIDRRLAAFREELLGRGGSVVQTELLQARVEKDVKMVQATMDTAVQTSPFKPSPPPSSSPSSLLPSIPIPEPPPPSWLRDHRILPPSQGDPGRPSFQPSKQDAACETIVGDKTLDNNNEKICASEKDACVDSSSQSLSTKGDDDSSHQTPVQYRQFLNAEKPQDGGKSDASPRLTSDNEDKISQRRKTSEVAHSSGSENSSHSAYRKSDDEISQRERSSKPTSQHRTDREASPRREACEGETSQPHESGDASFPKNDGENSRRRAARLSDGGDSWDLAERGQDSDNGSACSVRQEDGRKRKPRQDNAKQELSKQQGRGKRGATEQFSPRLANQNNSSARGAESSSSNQKPEPSSSNQKAESSSSNQKQERGRVIEDTELKHAHRRPPPTSDSGGQGHPRSGVERSRSGVMPLPQSSSSPARTSLSSAIGQVVENRLFDMSLSVLSSVDSVSSLQYSAVSPSPIIRHVSAMPECEPESDGEFSDDPLLLVLRQQRHDHEVQLRCLDAILAERNAS